ncbi:heat-inducible transcription repressor HrcA [Oribacterium sp. oral taxon 102]|nr:heat-inducible transcriptional repressor HrcA [Oribacterium sp. oral taxon 102]NWO20797.1 heat-inducible transcription repressor HrcA [Oribacterium sp. oral taxon 102]
MEMDSRKVVILTTIIKNYLETGEPVGSRTISKYSGLNLSSATIRNEMSDLEEMGFILQPHTSAGRIPSDKGYRFYVDQLMEHQRKELDEVKSSMFERVDKLENTLKTLVRTVAQNTEYAAMVTGPSLQKNRIKFIQVSLVDGLRILLVIMLEGNIIKTATILLGGSEHPDSNAILSLNLLLNDELSGLSVESLTEERCGKILARSEFRETLREILRGIVETLRYDGSDLQIYTSGATNIFKYPELTDSDNASKLISALEQKDELIELIQGVEQDTEATKRQIQVYIGKESPLQNMADCSVVTASYRLGNGMKGTIGVIGPKRMDYERVLEILSKLMNEMDGAFR